ncbi:MAG: biopolymer transporter ExbD [Phycisphaerae bacterium]|jgi:biopolymer transport protein ExbD|nr:biopolymer transporter ExbD [Phycisphaerae bacterium]
MEREVNQINVIPLVDVMLVLLVIVLTTATFITTGQIPVNLAKASTASDRQDRPLIVTVTADGRVFVEERPINEEELDLVLASRPRHSPVLVRADKTTRLERFVGIVDRIRGLGFQQVSLEVTRT